jgi:tRNA-2-methylthio-N6-dimethylallyladenosine synthase
MNVHDSRWLEQALTSRGFVPAPVETARVVVVNTCSVREKPERKVLSTLGRIRQATGGNPDVLVAVAGCVAQQLGETFFDLEGQVRLVIGSDGMAGAPQAIEALLEQPTKRLALLDFSSRYLEREIPATSGQADPVALVNIMQGCDNFCAYCIVPFTRGRQKSRPTSAVLDECRRLLDAGAREITLLGQNVNAFGKDAQADGVSFAELLRKVGALPGLARLRYVTPHPRDMGPEDVAAFAEIPALCPRLHLPLQSGADAVLARMGRGYDRAAYLGLVESLRTVRPDIAVSADIIVGFPGETEGDFQDTLDVMRKCAFATSFSFCYSDRPGTRASGFADKIPLETSRRRLMELQSLQEELGGAWLEGRVGETVDLLIEGRSPRQTPGLDSWQGRDPYGVPVHVSLAPDADHTGEMPVVRIVRAGRHSLIAEPA